MAEQKVKHCKNFDCEYRLLAERETKNCRHILEAINTSLAFSGTVQHEQKEKWTYWLLGLVATSSAM